MKVVGLGGSAAGLNTGAGSAGFLVSANGTTIVIDLGPGTLLELRKHVDYRSLDAIVISHYHLDHILDLGALRFLAQYNPTPISSKIALRVPPGSAERFAQWSTVFGDPYEAGFLDSVFQISEYDPDGGLTVGPIRIRFARTVHYVPAWAMRVSADGSGEFGYTADTGPTADLAQFFRDVSLLTSEATEPSDTTNPAAERGHMTASEAGQLASDANAGLLMLTHRWEELGLEQGALEAQTRFDGPVLIARPGLTVYV